MKYLLYNPLSNNKRGEKTVQEAKDKLKGKCELINLLDLDANHLWKIYLVMMMLF